jgi:hypothetical protein
LAIVSAPCRQAAAVIQTFADQCRRRRLLPYLSKILHVVVKHDDVGAAENEGRAA